MGRKTLCGILLTLLIFSMLMLAFNIQSGKAEPRTWTVDDDGPADFHTIYEAINAADSGDTIYVYNGIYIGGTLYLNENVSLVGQDRDHTIINGNDNRITIECTNVCCNVSGFTIQNGRTGILLLNNSGSNIDGNRIVNNSWYGIIVRESNNTLVNNNTVANNTNGVGLWMGSYHNSLIGNTVINQTDLGVEVWGENSILRNNSIIGNHFNFGAAPNNDIDTSNMINGKSIRCLANQHDILIDTTTFPDIGYLAVINCTNVTIRDLRLTDNYYGVLLQDTTNSVLQNVSLEENWYGVEIFGGRNNTVMGSSLSNNVNGIYLFMSTANQIVENMVANNERYGIFLIGDYVHPCCSNNIMKNTITNHTTLIVIDYRWEDSYGIYISSECYNNLINGNNITKNRGGISLRDGAADNNVLVRNTIASNEYGITLEFSKNNSVFHNNFINNRKQVDIRGRYPLNICKQEWGSYPYGGNYWSDYTGPDTDEDGIGDVAYMIDEYEGDSYPLMNPIDSSQTVHNLRSGLAYSTIQEAVDASETETKNIIAVDAKTYHENIVVDKPLILAGQTNVTTIIDGGANDSSLLIAANDVSVCGFAVTNADVGIRISADNSSLSQVRAYGNHVGILASECANGVISNCIIINQTVKKGESENFGGVGIALDQCGFWDIIGNSVNNNELIGVWIRGGFNLVENNIISNNSLGLELDWATYCTVTGNCIIDNSYGVECEASNCSFSANKIANNAYCAIELKASNNILVYHNNFMNNSNQVESYDSTNAWDNGCQGNYWSDYSGTSFDQHGIGDDPYVIDQNNIDHCPLMNPYLLGDVNHDSIVDIDDISIVVKAYGTQKRDEDWNPHADINEDGIVNLKDMFIVAKNFGKAIEG